MRLRKSLFVAVALALVATTAQAQTGSKLTQAEVNTVLKMHNDARAAVGVGPLTWDPTIATFAQQWADHLAQTSKFEHRPRQGAMKQKYGENLAGGGNIQQGIQLWLNEKSKYKGEVMGNNNYLVFGHYTQMVWENSKKIGCGMAKHPAGYFVIVCNYDPPGNFTGQKPYKGNGKPPVVVGGGGNKNGGTWNDKFGPNSGGPILGSSGFLTKNNPTDPARQGCFATTYSGVLRADRSYTITLTSKNFDTYLRLLDANGKQVAENDDSGGTTNSQLSFRPRQNGKYTVVVTTYGAGQTGAFELQISSAPAGGGGGQPQAKSDWRVPPPDAPGTLSGGPLLVAVEKLTQNSPRDTVRKGSHAKVFTGFLHKNRTYSIKLSSKAFDTFLRVEDANGKQIAMNDDAAPGNLNSALPALRVPADGTYRIIVTTYDPNATGEFRFELSY